MNRRESRGQDAAGKLNAPGGRRTSIGSVLSKGKTESLIVYTV